MRLSAGHRQEGAGRVYTFPQPSTRLTVARSRDFFWPRPHTIVCKSVFGTLRFPAFRDLLAPFFKLALPGERGGSGLKSLGRSQSLDDFSYYDTAQGLPPYAAFASDLKFVSSARVLHDSIMEEQPWKILRGYRPESFAENER